MNHEQPRPRHLSFNPYAEKQARIEDLRLAVADMTCDCATEHRDILEALLAEIEQLRMERDDFEQRLHAYKSGERA